MKRRGGDFESESDKGHDDAGGEQWLDRTGSQFLSDRGEPGRAAHAVNEAQPKKRERARGAAEKEIFEARFRGARVGFVEPRHDVERQAGQLETDEDHEQLFAADEEHESDRGEQEQREIFAAVTRSVHAAREDHGEKGERQADDFEERRERRDDQHAAEESRVRRQHEDRRRGEEEAGGGDSGTNSSSTLQ